MRHLFLLSALIVVVSSCTIGTYPGGGSGYPSGGNYPPGGNYPGNTYPGNSQPSGPSRSADKGVSVRSIRLTPDYTILDLTFTNNDPPKYDQNGRVTSNDVIGFQSTATLVAANGARVFRLIKVDGLPLITPQQPLSRKSYSGDVVNFTLYFERLDKGLEDFDLFECNDTDQFVCWNIYNLFVRNPADAVVYTPPVPVPTPVPTPTNPIPPTPAPKPAKPKPPVGQPLPPSQAGGETAAPAKPAPAPAPTLLMVSGTVSDAKNKRPLSATIDYQLSSSKKAVDSVQSFASTGGYRMTLAKGQVYTYIASTRGYLSASGVLDLSKATAGQTINRDIALTPLAIGDKITLKNIYFELSKSDLLAASFAELDKLVAMMEDSPNMSIRLEGHTDIIGDHDKNLQLSQDRVAACRAYLIRQGIEASRIQAVGFGDTRPILTTGSDEDRKVNRRVEFVVLSL